MDEVREFRYTDIGSKSILYLAKGLYPDPRDPIREYIQNGIDAAASETAVKVSKDSIVIENNGEGMDSADLWDALRIAISDKNPIEDAGYKGIGIYSGLLIAGKMIINSRKNNACVQLVLDFDKMQNLIEQNCPLPDVINEATEVIARDDLNFMDEALSGDGTQVELTGIRSELNEYYSTSALTNYLTNSIPLSFDPNFYYANQINQKIDKVCSDTGYAYRSTNLHLTTDNTRRTLYRPYKYAQNQVFKPHFEFISVNDGTKDTLLALVWGCLNQQRRVITDEHQRGFRYRLKGFAVGDAHTTLPYFSKGTTHSNRYVGEVVIFSNLIEANTARSDLAPTTHYPQFQDQLKKAFEKFEDKSNVFQEDSKANAKCDEIESTLADQIQSPTQEGISSLKDQSDQLRKRPKKPLKKKTKKRINKILNRLARELPKLEKKLKENEGDGETGSNISGDTGTNGNSKEDGSEGGDTGTNGDSKGDGSEKGGKGAGTSNRGSPGNAEVMEILDELNKSGKNSDPSARKIKQLYNSLCKISFEQHPCLSYIGIWTLWEIIGAVLSNPNQEAWNYLTQTLAQNYGTFDRQQYRDMKRVLQRIQEDGNANKHSPTGFGEDGRALKNHMEILDPFLLDMIEKVYEHLTGSPWRITAPPDNL